MEWLRSVSDFYEVQNTSEIIKVEGTSVICALIISFLLSERRLFEDPSLEVSMISVMMAFSVLFLGLLARKDGHIPEVLAANYARRTLGGRRVTLLEKTVIQITRLMILQISTLAFLLLAGVLGDMGCPQVLIGFVGIYMVANQLLSALQLVSELYLSLRVAFVQVGTDQSRKLQRYLCTVQRLISSPWTVLILSIRRHLDQRAIRIWGDPRPQGR